MIATIPCMTKNGHRAFVDTFTRLWDRAKAEGKSQEKFSKDIGVSQKTVSNILHAIENKRNIRLDTIESVAKGLGIETWQLLVPEMPIDLILNHRLTKLITSFKNADEDGRDFITRVAEKESEYHITPPNGPEDTTKTGSNRS